MNYEKYVTLLAPDWCNVLRTNTGAEREIYQHTNITAHTNALITPIEEMIHQEDNVDMLEINTTYIAYCLAIASALATTTYHEL